jgi:hypothetical protein
MIRLGRRRWLTVSGMLLLGTTTLAAVERGVPGLAPDRTDPDGAGNVKTVLLSSPVTIDGRLAENIWNEAKPLGQLRQKNPDEGKDATERTEVRVAYDDAALYIGARMFDKEPNRIVRELCRKDSESNSDAITIYLDPQHDHRSGVFLGVNASGSQTDGLIYDDSNQDLAWDGVWEAAVSVDSQGWSAEIRIPFSQLRFIPGEQQTWGLNFFRYIQRKNEQDWWQLVPKTESRLASGMGHLTGLDGVPEQRHMELMPYMRAGLDLSSTAGAGNPFHDGSKWSGGVGFDAKWGLASNLTLDAAVNPDFGQVEVDPAVVNLTAFETFYQEKRPFFIEGSQLYSNFGRNGLLLYGRFGANFPTIYYSRRIGRTPQGFAEGEFVDSPAATTILGATKLTRRTSSGWNMTFVDALTGKESARIAVGTDRSPVGVEPLTNYFAIRATRDFGRRGGFGILATSVIRSLEAPSLEDLLPQRATVVGGDGHFFFDKKRNWVASGSFAGSLVSGDTAAMERLQRSSARYFQRPDGQMTVDPAATALSGWSGQAEVNRRAGNLLLDFAGWAISPGFESNDLGYSPAADRIGSHIGLIWRKTLPDKLTRSRDLTILKWWTWNFVHDMQVNAMQVSGSATLHNYWDVQASYYASFSVQDDRLTRGGPSVLRLPYRQYDLFVMTDQRKPVSIQLAGGYGSNGKGGWSGNGSLSFIFKPSPALRVETGTELYRGRALLQYVKTSPDPTAIATFGSRYVFSDLIQTEVSLPMRVSWTFSPRISLQAYVQPLLSCGDYWGFKELARPRVFEYNHYGIDAGTINFESSSQRYTVDPDGSGPAKPFTFGNPDFNFKSLRLNMVFRWEWRLGSILYLVWTDRREDYAPSDTFNLGRDLRSMFHAPSDNVFMVKLAYWFGR